MDKQKIDRVIIDMNNIRGQLDKIQEFKKRKHVFGPTLIGFGISDPIEISFDYFEAIKILDNKKSSLENELKRLGKELSEGE